MSFCQHAALTIASLLAWSATVVAGVDFARIDEITISESQLAGHALVSCPGTPPSDAGARLLLTMASQPLALATTVRLHADTATFRFALPEVLPSHVGPFVGWLIPAGIVARTRDAWPVDAQLHLPIDSLGPASQSAWLVGGSNFGVAVGDTSWRRVGGQPIARFDALLVTPHLTFTRVTPLVERPPLRAGDTVQLWPAPGQQRTGQIWSAVSYIDDAVPLIWIAAPPGDDFPPEPHVDYCRAGQYLGHGVIERKSDRFWYARFTPLAASSVPAAILRPGDDVRVRTNTDIAARTYAIRVFELDGDNALLNAGEVDQVRTDDELSLYRERQRLASFVPTRVQRSYAVVPRQTSGGVTLEVGDRLWIRKPPPQPVPCATLHTVRGRYTFAATTGMSVPLGTPLAIRAGATTVGVAFVVAIDLDQAVGFALPDTLTANLTPGMTLSHD